MSHYLHVTIGIHHLLIETSGIIAITDTEAGPSRLYDQCVTWQDRQLPVSDVFHEYRMLSPDPTFRRVLIIFGNDLSDDNAFAVPVDGIVDAREIDDRSINTVSPFTLQFHRLIDGVLQDHSVNEYACLLRLRNPIESLAPAKESKS